MAISHPIFFEIKGKGNNTLSFIRYPSHLSNVKIPYFGEKKRVFGEDLRGFGEKKGVFGEKWREVERGKTYSFLLLYLYINKYK